MTPNGNWLPGGSHYRSAFRPFQPRRVEATIRSHLGQWAAWAALNGHRIVPKHLLGVTTLRTMAKKDGESPGTHEKPPPTKVPGVIISPQDGQWRLAGKVTRRGYPRPTAEGRPTKRGGPWQAMSVRSVLRTAETMIVSA